MFSEIPIRHGFALDAGPKTALIPAHPRVDGIDPKRLETLGNFRGAWVEGLMRGQGAQAGGGPIEAEIPFRMLVEEGPDAPPGDGNVATSKDSV